MVREPLGVKKAGLKHLKGPWSTEGLFATFPFSFSYKYTVKLSRGCTMCDSYNNRLNTKAEKRIQLSIKSDTGGSQKTENTATLLTKFILENLFSTKMLIMLTRNEFISVILSELAFLRFSVLFFNKLNIDS